MFHILINIFSHGRVVWVLYCALREWKIRKCIVVFWHVAVRRIKHIKLIRYLTSSWLDITKANKKQHNTTYVEYCIWDIRKPEQHENFQRGVFTMRVGLSITVRRPFSWVISILLRTKSNSATCHHLKSYWFATWKELEGKIVVLLTCV